MLKIMLNLFYQMFKVLILPLFLSMNLFKAVIFIIYAYISDQIINNNNMKLKTIKISICIFP